MIRCMSVMSCLAALGLYATAADAGDKTRPGGASKEAVEKAQKQLAGKLGDKTKGGTVVHIAAPALNRSLKGYEFFAVRFRLYPVARVIPEGMKPSNVFAVSKEGKVQHLKNPKELETFFRKHATAATSGATAGALAEGWLWLAQEFIQDGFYKFKIGMTEVMTKKGGPILAASATAVVMAGGNGEMEVTLSFDRAGKVDKAVQRQKIRPGPRPICQATKLLDPDPIVRRMAEQDLLYMGLAARAYLMEQRARARPELQQAIDRLWRRIEKEGW